MKIPKVSIIIPNYNHKFFLEERLNSVFNQSFQDFEVIILDDSSDDGSANILKNFRNHPKVAHCVFNKTNTGSPFKQWKKGLELAKGEYVWIAESDDSCNYDFLSKILDVFESNSEASIVVAKTVKYTAGKVYNEIKHHIFRHSEKETINNRNFEYCPILNVSSCVFKNPCLVNSNSEFDNFKIIGDRVFYYEFFSNHNIVKCNTTLSYFRKENESVSSLSNRRIIYYRQYFLEHLKLAILAYNNCDIDIKTYNRYVKKFYRRIRDRLKRKQKLSLGYLLIFAIYKLNLKS